MFFLEIYQECPKCAGIGQIPINKMDFEGNVLPPDNPRTCDKCDGEKRIKLYEIDGDLVDLVQDILNKLDDIKEKADEIMAQLQGN